MEVFGSIEHMKYWFLIKVHEIHVKLPFEHNFIRGNGGSKPKQGNML